MRKFVLTLFMASALIAGAQGFISPKARLLKQRYERYVTHAGTRGQALRGDVRGGFFVMCEKDADVRRVADDLKAKGASIRIVRGQQILLDIPLAKLDDLETVSGVARVDVGPRTGRKTDNTRRATQAAACNAGTAPQLPQAYTGKGVIVGIVDSGFDMTHPMFKDKDGNLRVKGYYMPGNTTFGGDSVRIGGKTLTGSYYSNPEDILDTLKVRNFNHDSHGTHCISIAAGSVMNDVNGLSGEPLGGVAPETDILICDMTSDAEHYDQVWSDGYDMVSFNAAESIEFMMDQAKKQKKPLVVSMSLNSHAGWHDGTSNMATLLGDYCKNEDLALMLCTGNEGGDHIYVNQTISAGDTLHLGVYPMSDKNGYGFCCLPTGKKVKLQLGIYDVQVMKELYKVPITLESTDKESQGLYFFLPEEKGISLKERMIYSHLKKYIEKGNLGVSCYKTVDYNQNGEKYDCTYVEVYHSDIVWRDGYHDNIGFMLHVMPREDTEAYAWGDVYDCFYKVNQGEVEYGSSDISMGDWNTSGEPVSVGAWIANNQIKTEDGATMETMDEIGDVAWYSSYGTDRAGHQHPDICAPGNYVAAALNSFDSQYSDYNVYLRKGYTDQFVGQTSSRDYSWGWMSGTSMSTPAAAGVVALWMQAAADLGKTLNCSDIKDIIIHSCDTDEFTARSPERFGLGKINAYKGLLYVLGIETSIEGLSKDQPENVTFRVADDLLYADGAENGTTVALYNLSGVLVRQTVLQGGTVSLAGLQKGVYAVQLGKLGSTLIRK